MFEFVFQRAPEEAQDPDRGLVMAAKDGNNDAFEDLVRKYQGQAYNIALRVLSDSGEAREAAQETFVKVYRALPSFRYESKFSHWFFAVLMNTCRSRRKKLRRRAFYKTDSLDAPVGNDPENPPREWPDHAENAEETLAKGQLVAMVRRTMEEVPDDFREVLVLRDVQGLEYEEIAAALAINIGTVKSRLHRGRGILKDLLTQALEEQ